MYQHKEPNIKIIYGGDGCVWISGFGCSVFIIFFFSYNDLCNMRYGIIKPLWTFKVDMEDSIIWQMEWNEIGLTFTLTLYVYIKAITRFFFSLNILSALEADDKNTDNNNTQQN